MKSKLFLGFLLAAISLLPIGFSFAQDPTGNVIDVEERYIATVTTSVAEIYEQPSTASAIVAAASLGNRLPLVEAPADGDAFYLVELRSTVQGYVSAANVSVELFEAPAVLAPDSATLYITLDTSPGMFDNVGTLFTVLNAGSEGAFIGDEINSLLELLFLNPDIDLDQIRGWLGDEVSIVNMRCLSSSMAQYIMEDTNQSTPSAEVVVLASVLNADGAEAFIDAQFESGDFADIDSIEVEYGGYTYRLLTDELEAPGEPENPVIAMGIVDDHLVFTQGRSTYEAVIDVANGVTPSLAETDRFERVYGDLDLESFLRIYVGPSLFCPVHDPILYDSLLNETFSDGALDIAGVDPSDPAALQEGIRALIDEAFDGYAIGFREDGSGVTLDLISGIDSETLSELTGLSDEEIQDLNTQMGLELFGFLTPYALEAITFGTLAEDYDALSNLSADTPDNMFESGTGITSDVLEWIDGSITMGFMDYPVYDATVDTDPHFFMVVEPAPNATGDQIQASYDGFIQATLDSGAVIEDESVRETSAGIVTTVVTGEGENQRILEIGAIDDYYLLIATGGNFDRIVEAGTTQAGEFTPNWRLLADLTIERDGVGNAETVSQSEFTDPFVAALDLGSYLQGGRLEVVAVVAPPLAEGEPSRISIICAICRNGERCFDNPSQPDVADISNFTE